MRKTTLILPVLALIVVGLMSAIFIVDEREKALVLQFGQIKQVKEDPGLGFKIPLIQEVVRYDDRILSLDTQPTEVTPSDDRRLVVDAFARYRIEDVIRFREAIGAGGIRSAETRLENILNAQIRAVLGSDGVTSNTILSEDRSALMERITQAARNQAEALGVFVLDVRLKQTNLPTQNLDATFARMRAEREREAADEIARGEEAAQRIRALADRTVVELVSDAQREAEITRGEADAERSGIFAEAFGADPEFFEFYRSLSAYQRSLNANNSTMVLSPDSEFFDYLKSAGEGSAPPPPAAQDEAPDEGADQGAAPADEAAQPGDDTEGASEDAAPSQDQGDTTPDGQDAATEGQDTGADGQDAAASDAPAAPQPPAADAPAPADDMPAADAAPAETTPTPDDQQ